MYEYKLLSTGYLYTCRNGDFKVREGRLMFREKYPYSARFYVNDRRFYMCSPKSGEIANASVWFPERNDELARDMFMLYEENKIAKLQEEIVRRQENLITISCTQFK